MNVYHKIYGVSKSINIKNWRTVFRSQYKGFPFKVNTIIFFAVVLSTVLLIPSLNHPIFKPLFASTLSLALGLSVMPFLEFTISLKGKVRVLMSIHRVKKYYSHELEEEFVSLSNLMKVKTRVKNPIGIVANWINAGAKLDNSIILGQPIVEEFEKDERMGILAHELAHLKGNHPIKCASLMLPIIVVLLYSLTILQLPWFIEVLIMFSFFGFTMPIIYWPFEYKADATAAQYTGKEHVISALIKLADKNNTDIDLDSYTHPSISRRINRLNRLKVVSVS